MSHDEVKDFEILMRNDKEFRKEISERVLDHKINRSNDPFFAKYRG